MKNLSFFSIQLLMVVIILVLSGCSQISSSEVDASAVYGELSLTRSQSSTTATAGVTFYVGGPTGTVINLDSPAVVTINGKTANSVTEPIINITSYQQSVAVSSGIATIIYQDKDGTSYSNSLPIPGDFSFTVPGTVSKSAGFNLAYTSDIGFFAGEQLELTLQGNNNSIFENFSLVTGAKNGTQNISASSLGGVTPGTLTVSICRASYPAAQAPYPKGTSVSNKSCSSSTTVNLVN